MNEGIEIDPIEVIMPDAQEAGEDQTPSLEHLRSEIAETEHEIKQKFGAPGERLVELLNAPQ